MIWDRSPLRRTTTAEEKNSAEMAKEYADNHPYQPPLITVNAWNEWPESSYLVPDNLYGYGYLEAVKRIFGSYGINIINLSNVRS
ncbi:MAG: glycoside hydrolase family 99-like domain-containing protein [Oscillospiraceae bacterium]|nr:glycoside hydrolase family 99-like domain-containing protein [Oscillospiraceae bacterium]